jgi:tRNA pseudouridine13 synthase
MKVKSLPTDFIVREQTKIRPTTTTTSNSTHPLSYALYRLEKTSIGTPEAIQTIVRSWKLRGKRNQIISYGGLKDRHAQTSQYVTIQKGPPKDFHQQTDPSSSSSSFLRLQYLGQTTRHFISTDIDSNQFEITIRGISPLRKDRIHEKIMEQQQQQQQQQQFGGVVNFFDDQRFGSVGISGQFIAEPWCTGNYERVLYLALAEENQEDRSKEKKQKEILRKYWGNWSECKNHLIPSARRNIVQFLEHHPKNFKQAVARIRSDLRRIYVSAFQSRLWNQWLSRIIETRCDGDVIRYYSSALGPLAMPNIHPSSDNHRWDWLRNLQLPLPTARQHEWPEDLVTYLDEILQPYGLERRQIRLKYPRDAFFSKGLRSCWFQPTNLTFQWQSDELNTDMYALHLKFSLPRGVYATMLIKAITDDHIPSI